MKTTDLALGSLLTLGVIIYWNPNAATQSQQSVQPAGQQARVGFAGELSNIDALREAIIGKESGGDFTAINPHSGALGYGQVMPENLPSWSQAALGREISVNEFLNSPDLQIQIINHKLQEYWNHQIKAGYDKETAVRRVASMWYSGQGDLYDDPTPQTYGAGSYPSIREYTLSILNKVKSISPF